ncbi:MAG: flagellar hook-length control protein FliK [Candidatus Krumholzibacteriia bacterium]
MPPAPETAAVLGAPADRIVPGEASLDLAGAGAASADGKAAASAAPAAAAQPEAETQDAAAGEATAGANDQTPAAAADAASAGPAAATTPQAASAASAIPAGAQNPAPDVAGAAPGHDPAPLPSAQRPDAGGAAPAAARPGGHSFGAAAPAAPARTVPLQVARGLAAELERPGGGQQVTLRLNPESLGQVDVRFDAQGSHLTVTLTATEAAAGQALREGLDELSRNILRRGDRFQTVEIRVEQREGNGPRQELRHDERRDGQPRSQDGQGGGRQPRREPGTTAEAWADLARGGR